jgi:hypothetical protein
MQGRTVTTKEPLEHQSRLELFEFADRMGTTGPR